MQIEPLMVSEEARASGVEMESCSWAFSIQFRIRFSIHLTKGANPGGGYLGAQLYLICVCILPRVQSRVSPPNGATNRDTNSWGRSLGPSPLGRQGLLSL